MKLVTKAIAVTLIASIVCSASAVSSAQDKQQTKLNPASSLTALLGQALVATHDSLELSKSGDSFAKTGNWKAAGSNYQNALAIWKDNQAALYGLAKCSQAVGDTAGSLKYYRTAIYSTNSADMGFRETNPARLIEYSILLEKAGQSDEAMFVYNHAASRLDYQDGKPSLKVLLPELVEYRVLPDQVRYTPECLQALADTALAHEEMAFGSDKEALAHLRDAVKLYPDSPVTHYYLGEALLMKDGAGAKAAYQKAIELGDDSTVAAAKERLKMIP